MWECVSNFVFCIALSVLNNFIAKSMLEALKEAILRHTEYQVALSQLGEGLAQDHSEKLAH